MVPIGVEEWAVGRDNELERRQAPPGRDGDEPAVPERDELAAAGDEQVELRRDGGTDDCS